MPLTRYEIRNEYTLADPELFKAADKDDPEALLEGVAMAGLVGVLRQLGDLAEFASELFHDLHEEVMATSARGHRLMNRLQQIEGEFPSVEKALLSRTSHSEFLYNSGVDWRPNLRMDQNLVARGDLPRFVMDSYEECRGPPRLFLLDKFDVAGAGACLKRYSDPSFFKQESTSPNTIQTENQRENKARKIKKKALRLRNGETPEVVLPTHSKLHQLLSMDRSQTENNSPMHRVKLKRRQSNCSLIDSKSGKSYMERFASTPSPESKFPYESSVSPLRLTMESNNSGELVSEIHETPANISENKLEEKDISAAQSLIRRGVEQSFDELDEDVMEEGILRLADSTPDSKVETIPSTLHKVDKTELGADEDTPTEASTVSDSVPNEIDKYVDALTIVESEMERETENRPKNEIGFRVTGEMGKDSCADEGRRKHQTQLPDSYSAENSNLSDDENNLFTQHRFSLSYSSTSTNLTKKVPSDSNAAAEVHPPTEVLSDVVSDMWSRKHSDTGDIIIPTSPQGILHSDTDGQVSGHKYSLEFAEASCDTSSNVSPGESMKAPQLEVSDLIGAMPCLTKNSDLSSEVRDDEIPLKRQTVEVLDDGNPDGSCEALVHPYNILDLDSGKENDDNDSLKLLPTKVAEDSKAEIFSNELDKTNLVILPTVARCFEEQDPVASSATAQPECLPMAFTHDGMSGMKCDSIGEETEYVASSTEEKSEDLLSVVKDEPELLKTTCKVPSAEQNSTSDTTNCTGVEPSSNNLVVLPNRTRDELVFPHNDASLDSSSRYINSGTSESASVEVHSQPATLGSGSVHTEVANEDIIIGHKAIDSSSGAYVRLLNECHNNEDPNQHELKSTEASIDSHLIGSGDVNGSKDSPTGYAQELSDVESSKSSDPELSHGVHYNPPLPETSVNILNASDGTNGLPTSRESHKELEMEQQLQSHLSESMEETTSSSIHLSTGLQPLLEQGLEVTADEVSFCSVPPESSNDITSDDSDVIAVNPLSQPPDGNFSLLARDHKLENSETYVRPSLCPEAKESQPLDSRKSVPGLESSHSTAPQESNKEMLSCPPLPHMEQRAGKRQRDSVTSEEVPQPGFNPFWQLSPATAKEGRQGFPILEGGSAQYVNPFLPLPTTDEENSLQGPQMSGREFLQPSNNASLTSEEEMVQHPNSFTNPSVEDEKHGSLNTEEIADTEHGRPNGIRRTKIPRPRDPLIEAVASHDKSMLRKVSERVLPQPEPKVDDRNSLLEQIRNKSFSLKPAVATRPSIHGPRTNLKVVAILEKANAIRQALAGSDDDEDEDSWSDS